MAPRSLSPSLSFFPPTSLSPTSLSLSHFCLSSLSLHLQAAAAAAAALTSLAAFLLLALPAPSFTSSLSSLRQSHRNRVLRLGTFVFWMSFPSGPGSQ